MYNVYIYIGGVGVVGAGESAGQLQHSPAFSLRHMDAPEIVTARHVDRSQVTTRPHRSVC